MVAHMRTGQMYDLHDVHLHLKNSFALFVEIIAILHFFEAWKIPIYCKWNKCGCYLRLNRIRQLNSITIYNRKKKSKSLLHICDILRHTCNMLNVECEWKIRIDRCSKKVILLKMFSITTVVIWSWIESTTYTQRPHYFRFVST